MDVDLDAQQHLRRGVRALQGQQQPRQILHLLAPGPRQVLLCHPCNLRSQSRPVVRQAFRVLGLFWG